ncbi:DUF4128 family protein [Synechococcus phage Ssp-JY42]
MSLISIRAALETALDTVNPALATQYENAPFTPTPGTAYQAVNLLTAQPRNDEVSRSHVEQGLFQITLRYPQNTGPAAAAARANLIRATFYRGASFTSGSVTVTVNRTPEILPAFTEGDRYVVPVRVPFEAPITA